MECQFKQQYVADNWGLKIRRCSLLHIGVNDAICAACPHRTGTTPIPESDDPIPTRPPREVERVYNICKGCPFFDIVDQTCSKLRSYPIPVDIYAENPRHQCPEGLW